MLSAALATWVINGGYTTIYYEFAKYGYLWALIELPFVFLLTVSVYEQAQEVRRTLTNIE